MISHSIERKQWHLVDFALRSVRPLGFIAFMLGALSLLGYALGIDVLYRPVDDGPATHPLTALTTMLMGCGMVTSASPLPLLRRLSPCFLLALVVTCLRLFEVAYDISLVSRFMPFRQVVVEELQQGKSNSMGFNTAAMFFLAALSALFAGVRWSNLAQLFASIALCFPLVAFVGYIYGQRDFYGQMSLITATFGLIVIIGILFSTANYGALRAMLSPYLSGTIARLQSILGTIFPYSLGFALSTATATLSGKVLAVYVILTSWFIVLMVGVAAIYQEQIDQQRRRLTRRLSDVAALDELTDLPNRRKFHDFIGQKISDNVQHWLLLIDIDHFKRVNDTAGHDVGDRVLQAVATELARRCASDELVARVGGEEFAVVLPHCSQGRAWQLAETIRESVMALTIPEWTQPHGILTVSIGLVNNNGDLELTESYRKADKALYAAKRGGRNRCCMSEELETASQRAVGQEVSA
ncbi:GGDEF domain-containing protein [Pseudidiomarina sediminum]|uniref:diguanylate cyclase n=1 Tax=Pseudidiomarina sediminum TaxID=431675 RepID=A0A432Z9X2_9GAMM|nr:diguanylate cyclase [Pseudidiomarina sediminum]MBY6063952.1 diguanylate cyclase [Pseudidiomarina sediminum]RUO74753.1 GGDEF domain-containing protein [Pseudidiomarina sediminum]